MLENIKSNYIGKLIFEYIQNKTVLNIFKYSKFYQSKFCFSKNDYLSAFYFTISKDIIDDYFNEDEKDRNFEKQVKLLKCKVSPDVSNDVLKESAIAYFSLKKDYILSINHIYFNEIIEKKIELGHKNIKIKFRFVNWLSQSNIIDLISRHNYSNEKIIKYINEKMDLNNKLIKKLEVLLNANVFINEFYFDFDSDFPCYIDYKYDIIEYKENETDEEKNILINFKSKRGELINKILDKNCKNITKMKYLIIINKPLENTDITFPLVDLDKFENLISLDLNIFADSKEFNYNFTNNLNKLKYLKIKIKENENNDCISDIYINKKTLDNLEILKIKNANLVIPYKESFHFKKIKNLDIKIGCIPKESSNQKKYFYEELLKGNLSWEKLERFKISLCYWCEIEDKEEFINKEIIDLLKISSLRDSHDASYTDFFPKFFNYIFENQNICIKTNNSNNKNIEQLIIKIYDDNPCLSCTMDNIIYDKKGKNVDITVGGRLFDLNRSLYDDPEDYPIKFINLENIYLDPSLGSFTIENKTINELKSIKKYISVMHEKTKIITKNYKTFYDIYKEKYSKGNINLENEINKLKEKNELLEKQDNLMWEEIYKKNGFDRTILKIKRSVLSHKILQIHRLIRNLTDLSQSKINNQNDNKEDKINP